MDLFCTGKYLYMEASDRSPGDKAIVSTDYLRGGQPVCVSFWYHMNGADTGDLSVYYKTNTSRVLLWQSQGHKGDLWLFGQTSYNTTEAFKVRDFEFQLTIQCLQYIENWIKHE